MRKLAIGMVVVLLFLCVCMAPAALADNTGLQSSAIVINGTAYVDTLSVPGVISSSGFGPSTVGTSVYGTVTVTLTNTGTSAETVSVDGFFDAELSLPFFNEYAAVNGAPGCGAGCTQNYEVGDPIYSNIVNDTLSDTLSNTNAIPKGTDNFSGSCATTCSGSNGDVSFAMGFDFTLQPGQTDTVEFVISPTNPGGFNIDQTHPVDGSNTSATDAFFSGSVVPGTVGPPPPPPTPEPATLLMLGSSIIGLAGMRKRFLKS